MPSSNYSETLVNDKLRKLVKPISDTVSGGEYSEQLLPYIESFRTKSELYDNLEELRAGNKVPDSKDLTTTNIEIKDETINSFDREVHIQTITPENASLKRVLIYFHGGSFYGGHIQDAQNLLKLVAEKSNLTIINVDYGLAPESPFPSAILDGVAVSIYAKKVLNFEELILGGDSAGGNISLGVNEMLHQFGYKLTIGSIVLYPVVTLADDDNLKYWDLKKYPIRDDQRKIRDNYLAVFQQLNGIMREYYLRNDENSIHGLVSPLYSDSTFKKPTTLVVSGEFDFFRLQDEAFAEMLARNGSDVTYIQYNGMAHAYAPMVGILPQADDTAVEMANFIGKL